MRYCTCEGVIPSIMMVDYLLILSEYVEPVVILLSVINFFVLHVEKRNVMAYTKGIIEV